MEYCRIGTRNLGESKGNLIMIYSQEENIKNAFCRFLQKTDFTLDLLRRRSALIDSSTYYKNQPFNIYI